MSGLRICARGEGRPRCATGPVWLGWWRRQGWDFAVEPADFGFWVCGKPAEHLAKKVRGDQPCVWPLPADRQLAAVHDLVAGVMDFADADDVGAWERGQRACRAAAS